MKTNNIRKLCFVSSVTALVLCFAVNFGQIWAAVITGLETAEQSETGKVEAASGPATQDKIQYLGDVVKVGADVVVRANEKVNDVVAVMGNATVHGSVGGDIVVVHGNAEVNGKVAGDCVLVLGTLKLGPNAEIGGETIVVGGHLDKAPEAKMAMAPKEISFEKWAGTLEPLWKWVKRGLLLCRPLPPSSGFAWFFVGLFFLIYLIIMLLMPRAVGQCVKVLENQAITAFGVGLVALILFGPLILLLIASGIGLLAVPFVMLGLLAVTLVGKAGSFHFIGLQLTRRTGASVAPESLVNFLVGVLLVTVLYMIPILGCVVWSVLVCLGLGAAIVAIIRSFRVNGPAAAPASRATPSSVPTGGVENGVGPGAQAIGTQMSSGIAVKPGAERPPCGAHSPAEAPPLDYAALPRVGFWLRLAATVLDLILLGWFLSFLNGAGIILWIAYHVAMWTWKGTTIGGIICRIKIVREDGHSLDFGSALVRALVAVFSFLALGLGFFWAGWSRDKQSWHDKVAGTIVVKVPHNIPLV